MASVLTVYGDWDVATSVAGFHVTVWAIGVIVKVTSTGADAANDEVALDWAWTVH